MARVVAQTGMPREVCDSYILIFWNSIAYFMQRPWLFAPKFKITGFFHVRLQLGIIAIQAMCSNDYPAAQTIDRYLVSVKNQAYIRKRNTIVNKYNQFCNERKESSQGDNSDGHSNKG